MRKNERTPTGTDVQNCLLGFVREIFFLFAQRTIVHELWSSEKRQVEARAFHKRECVVFNGVVSYNTYCFIEWRKISPACKIKPIPNLGNAAQIIYVNMFQELCTLLRKEKLFYTFTKFQVYIYIKFYLINETKSMKERRKWYQIGRVSCTLDKRCI